MSYVLPLSAHDLAVDQRYETFIHEPGFQGEGKDFRARRHKSNNWPEDKFDGANMKVLSNWVIYGKPFYAMGAGTVVGGWRNAPENEPGSFHADYVAKRFAPGGNHLWILQDDGVYALYAHAKPGSIPTALCPNNDTLFTGISGPGGSPDIAAEATVTDGAKVKAGQFLGQIGNSGESKVGPHLHVHMEKDGNPVVMTFERGMTTPFFDPLGFFNGPWTKLEGKALPKTNILVWAPHPVGNYTFNATPAAEYKSLFDHMSDSGMMPDIITCKLSGAFYDSTWIPSQGSWVSHHGMTPIDAIAKHATYTAQGYQRTSSFTCGFISVAVWRK